MNTKTTIQHAQRNGEPTAMNPCTFWPAIAPSDRDVAPLEFERGRGGSVRSGFVEHINTLEDDGLQIYRL